MTKCLKIALVIDLFFAVGGATSFFFQKLKKEIRIGVPKFSTHNFDLQR